MTLALERRKSGLVIPKVIHKDPPGLVKAKKYPSIFSNESHRNLGTPQIPYELDAVPDDILIATLVEYGQPRWAADEVRNYGAARFFALRFYCDVLDAAEGDKQAKERVDYCRWCWEEMRRNEQISDIPDQASGLLA